MALAVEALAAEQPYANPIEHMRDELYRVWLRVEYQIRRGWEQASLPRVSDELSSGVWSPSELGGLFRGAHQDFFGGRAPADGEAGSDRILDELLAHSRRVDARRKDAPHLPLERVSACFQLSRRQREALIFALMPELDPNLLTAYRYLSHDPTCRGLDARLLALLVYDTTAARAQLSRDLSPRSPLLFYRLLEQDEAGAAHDAMLYRRLCPAGRLVQMLGEGDDTLDAQLCDVAELRRGEPSARFPEAVITRAEAMHRRGILLVLQGQRGVGKRLLAQVAAARRGRPILLVDARTIARRPPAQLQATVRGILREAYLLDAVVVVPEIDDAMETESTDLPPLVEQLCADAPHGVVITVSRERLPRLDTHAVVHLTLEIPSHELRSALWRDEVPSLSREESDVLSERFAAPGGTIALAARTVADDAPPDVEALDCAVRAQLHDRIVRLGRQLDTPYDLDDLIVEEDVCDALGEIVSCVLHRRQVRERWGFRGAQGVSVLFSGDPGVGKTMSATVLARQLGLAIYEVDLSRIVSKWIGETEKNLSDLFDAAEPGHVMLLFNEADSLFGKRTTDVKTANDRYANLETNYLLQRLERFNGLAVLTTNLGGAIDAAFRRRFAYDVRFSFPSSEMRSELWRRAIPIKAEVSEIDWDALGERYALSGGFIKVAAERSAFVAAATEQPISDEVIDATVQRMYRERGKLAGIGQLE